MRAAPPPTDPEPTPAALANAVRALAIDATETAKSGHPGLPLGMADVASLLWRTTLAFDAADPAWPDRDRFVLSAGHGSPLLYALLALTGHHGMEIDVLRRFRQPHSPACGYPVHAAHPAVEATTGPPGQGFANACGMALAERLLAARFGRSLVDHRCWVIAGEADLATGLSHEAASLAGELRLSKLTVLYDAAVTATEEVTRRFATYGWAVKAIDGHDPAQIASALAFAQRARKPTLIACRTIAAFGTPERAGGRAAHAGPLGPAAAAAAKRALGCADLPFVIAAPVLDAWRAAGARCAALRRGWLRRLSRHPRRGEFERVIAGRLPENWQEGLAAWRSQTMPRSSSGAEGAARALQAQLPELIGGVAARGEIVSAAWSGGMPRVGPNSLGGRYIEYGAREHAMMATMNGMALHGGLIPWAGGLLAHADYLRPALRLAAVMRQRVILLLAQEAAGGGDDGPAQQADAQLASLRAIAGLWVFRPADALEEAECWELALRRADGPSVLVLPGETSQACAGRDDDRCARGGYVLAEAAGARALTLLASGAEVALALQARLRLAEQGIACAVVSLPCWALFAAQTSEYRAGVLGTAPRLAFEAGCGFGWERWLGEEGVFLARGSDLSSAGAGYAVQAAARILCETDIFSREPRT